MSALVPLTPLEGKTSRFGYAVERVRRAERALDDAFAELHTVIEELRREEGVEVKPSFALFTQAAWDAWERKRHRREPAIVRD